MTVHQAFTMRSNRPHSIPAGGFCPAFILLAALLSPSFVHARELVVVVGNPGPDPWPEAPVIFPWPADLDTRHRLWVLKDTDEFDVQIDDLDGDGRPDEAACLVSLAPGQTRRLTLAPAPPDHVPPRPRAHARMSLKGYDGVGWESDRAAWRIYWNADNAMDIFGKTRPVLSLDAWATPGVSHNIENEWGLDVLKVARSIGIGGFGAFIDGRVHKVSNVMKTFHIRADGPLRAVVDLEYVYWQPGDFPQLSTQAITSAARPHYDLWVRMSVFAGQHWAEASLTLIPHRGSPRPEIVTGMPLHADTELIADRAAGILGRWGRQALGDHDAPAAGNLGLGVVVDPEAIVDWGEDHANTFVRLRLQQDRVLWRYHGSWWKEPNAPSSASEYEQLLRELARLRPEVAVERP